MRVDEINDELRDLTEAGLKGLAFEADRHASFEDIALWRGIAEHARRRRSVLAAHRSGKGDWYAVVRAHRSEGLHEARVVAKAHVRDASRLEAIEEGRRLMVAKAAWPGQDVRIDVTLYSALEWQPEENE